MEPDLCRALYKAVIEGDQSTLRPKLLEAERDDLEKQQEWGYQNKDTLLHIATNHDNVEVVKVIREELPISRLRRRNYRKDTALHIAARHYNVDVVWHLLGWAKEVDGKENQSRSDNLPEKEKGNRFDQRHKIANIRNRDGNTALHEAVLGRHQEVIKVLMESVKELIFMKNNRKESPLYLAADRGLQDVLDEMLEVALEDPDFEGKKDYILYDGPNGRTPLHAAIANKCTSKYPLSPSLTDIRESIYSDTTQPILFVGFNNQCQSSSTVHLVSSK